LSIDLALEPWPDPGILWSSFVVPLNPSATVDSAVVKASRTRSAATNDDGGVEVL
jgi:hypothetical protein